MEAIGIIERVKNAKNKSNEAQNNEAEVIEDFTNKIAEKINGGNTNKSYTIGQEVTIKGEKFYVMETSESSKATVKLLAEKNITTDTLEQSDSAPTVRFSSTNYWNSETTWPVDLNNYTIPDGETSIITIANAYGEKIGGSGTIGRLMTMEEVGSLGGAKDTGKTSNCPSWINTTSYWLGSGTSYSYAGCVWGSVKDYGGYNYDNSTDYGVRPVIEILKSKIESNN